MIRYRNYQCPNSSHVVTERDSKGSLWMLKRNASPTILYSLFFPWMLKRIALEYFSKSFQI